MPSSNIRLRARRQPEEQIAGLEHCLSKLALPSFEDAIAGSKANHPQADAVDILQVNLGKMCNQTCSHCHVDAGPTRKEIMKREVMEACLLAFERLGATRIDITGGAPEMNPHFRWFVEEARQRGAHVMVRCNLTIILANPKYEDLPDFYAKHHVEVISSLPHFAARRTDAQRGTGVFAQSIEALRRLNAVGYAQAGSTLELHLVYNPSGAFMPAAQEGLERTFKEELLRRHGLRFNHLYAITNMPISRFYDYLENSKNLDHYMRALVTSFNASTLRGLMCRNTLSVGWDGKLYDCDFNQMLELPLRGPQHIADADASALQRRRIRIGPHCYGCTAGTGSSCGGKLL